MAASNLFQQYLQPPKSAIEYSNEYEQADALRGRNALQALTLQQQTDATQQSLQERNALRRIAAGSGGDRAALIGGMRSSGLPGLMTQADALEQSGAKLAESQATAAKNTAEAAKQQGATLDDALKRYRSGLDFIDTPQGAARWVAAQYQDPLTGAHLQRLGPVEQLIARIPQDPAGFQQWRQQAAVGMDKFIDNQRQAAQQAETVRHNKAGEGLTARGQDMADARTREANESAVTKPFEVTDAETGQPTLVRQDKAGNITPVKGYGPKAGSSKPLTDAQAKALGFGSRMQESNKILADLEGKYSPAAVNAKVGAESVPIVGGVAGAVGNLMLGDEGQQVEQAQRDFVNAVLRRESGAAISNSEFENARKQYFPQPNDKPGNLAQKARNRALAIQGVLAEVPTGQRDSLSKPPAGGKAAAGGAKPSVSNW